MPTIWALAEVSTAAIGLRQVVTGLGTHRFLDNEGESYDTTGRPTTGRLATGSVSSTVRVWPTSGIVWVHVQCSGLVPLSVWSQMPKVLGYFTKSKIRFTVFFASCMTTLPSSRKARILGWSL